jgi:hypothetical protein
MQADSKRLPEFARRISIAICVAHLSTAALSASLPSFDIKAACSIFSRDGEPQTSNLYQDCIENEAIARDHLSQTISGLPAEKMKICADSISKEGSPSYLALLGCVEQSPQPNASVGDAGPKAAQSSPPSSMAAPGKDARATSATESVKSVPGVTTPDKASAKLATGQAFQFTHDLGIGTVDPDVKALQAFLNSHDALVASAGPGAPGQEVDVFGLGTQAALIKFQEAHKAEVLTAAGITKATGFFGSTTRNYVNKLVTGH